MLRPMLFKIFLLKLGKKKVNNEVQGLLTIFILARKKAPHVKVTFTKGHAHGKKSVLVSQVKYWLLI